MSQESEWERFWEQQSQEALNGEGGVNPVQEEGWVYLSFVSRSNGRGRKPRRRYRDVELAKNVETGRTVVLKDIPTGGLDTLAQALFAHLGEDINPWEIFVMWLKRSRPENGTVRKNGKGKKKKTRG